MDILTLTAKNEEILKFCQNGDILLKGKLIESDKDLTDGFRYFLNHGKTMYFDEMFEMLKESKQTIQRLRLSMSAHPDCEEDSEFADYVDLADYQETKIEQLLTKITQ